MGADNIIIVKPEELTVKAEQLKNDTAEPMDYLRDIVGMDWGEEGLGALYYLECTSTGNRIVLKTMTPDRENAFLPSVCHLWKTAKIKEREVFDFFGIRFTGNPDMRRIFLREDWKGFPLRKDYDMDSNPLNMENEVNADVTEEYTLRPDGTIEGHENVVFGKEDFVVNIGPQHPSTHGVLRMRTSIDGENIRHIDPVLGYIHRGIEKMNESLTYQQTLALTDRLDYLSAHQNRHALCMCIEQAAGIEISERAQYIRTIMDELQRIDSHLLFYSCLVMDMGGLTPFFYGFREREMILDIMEETTGGRLIQNYNVIGGVQADLHPDFRRKVKEFIRHLRSVIKDYHRRGCPLARGCHFAWHHRRHGTRFGMEQRREEASSVCDVRQSGFPRDHAYGGRLVRALHGAYGRDYGVVPHHRAAVVPHHRAAYRQYPGRGIPREDETCDKAA